MSFSFDIRTTFLLASIIGGLGAFLATTVLRGERDPSLKLWLGYAAVQSISSFMQSTRGQWPEAWAIILANGAQLLALGLLWLGARRLRGFLSPGWLAVAPALLWLALCAIPGFVSHPMMRLLVLWPLLLLLLAATSLELWRAYRHLALRSALYLCVLIGLIAIVPAMWLVELMLSMPYVIGNYAVLAIAVMNMAVPFIALAIAIERMGQVKAQSQMNALQAGRAQIERLHGGLPAIIYLREVMPGAPSRLVYRAGDVEAVLGWPAATFDGVDSFEPWMEGDWPGIDAVMARTLAEGNFSCEYRFRQPNGSWRWLRTRCRLLSRRPNGGGEVVGYILDSTSEREAEARAMASARLASFGELAAGLAHELKQPLQSISLCAEGVQFAMRRQEGSRADSLLEDILDQIQRTAALIDHLRRFARGAENGAAMEAVPVEDAVQGALSLARGLLVEAGISIEIDLGETPPVVLGQSVLLEQVLSNLILNARDAILAHPPAGPSCVRIGAGPGGRRGKEGPGGEEMVQITVGDTGGGITPAVMARLFEPFVTTKAPDKGTGLGLSICHGLIKGMGGSIEARNDAEGAVFIITLPRFKPAGASPRAVPA